MAHHIQGHLSVRFQPESYQVTRRYFTLKQHALSITAVRLGLTSFEMKVMTALCNVVPLRCVDFALRDCFLLFDHIDVPLLLLPDDTVGDAVDVILHAYHSRPDAPPRTESNASSYVLRMTDNDVSLADRRRMLCTYEHVHYCLATSQPLRVTVTLATDDVLARDETFLNPYTRSVCEQ
ncbi:hypothetical protein SPRG_08111 [Saprolegnia parasitica CBS 223.65]|uniref:PI3K-RBD domain-containing protein n=1 Tax=Saprolegnia parasitica (strain CBS 223.65) TaxID=695850 RepID=A0A067CJW0_SAPPC|nr:hypothetical protein SPRG_08111 [Saprolegnia parasitica CBS 223.65]KDO26821.1 hypothetical protein SPRG_08111 [Saprolegnia parasitica CBS 223.65]|eukprot:XP_012202469.1 hypothetical protein SPRG_08111 [Saprolegnia parasitica CBS 223.65]